MWHAKEGCGKFFADSSHTGEFESNLQSPASPAMINYLIGFQKGSVTSWIKQFADNSENTGHAVASDASGTTLKSCIPICYCWSLSRLVNLDDHDS